MSSHTILGPIKRAAGRLERLLPGKIAVDVSMAKHTTLRVGGPAAIFAVPDTLAELRIVIETVTDYELPLLMLGRGSNLLVGDGGFSGIVLQLGQEFKRIELREDTVSAGAAVPLPTLVQMTTRHELGGLDFAVGIPGTVGAAIAVNAGAYGSDMGKVTRIVTLYTTSLEMRTVDASRLEFEYRRCLLPPDSIIIEAQFGLYQADGKALKYQMEINWRRRRRKQPQGLPNAGSMFKNPPDDHAGRLIESAGLKGKTIGGAKVSEAHANFFVNSGGAKAIDFLRLIDVVSDAVKDQFGMVLEPEIKIVGNRGSE